MNQKEILLWDIHEITAEKTPIHGVMFRGRIRKLCLEQRLNVLVENDSEPNSNIVRFATLDKETARIVDEYVLKIIPDAIISTVMEKVPNPVLSKLMVNKEERYILQREDGKLVHDTGNRTFDDEDWSPLCPGDPA